MRFRLPMRWPQPSWPLLIAVPAIVAAAALGRYAYRQSKAVYQLSEEAIRQSNAAIADRVVSVIEQEIIASDHTLFDLIDLGALGRFRELWTENLRRSPTVEAVVVLDGDQRIVALASRGRKESRLRQLFVRHILPNLHLGGLDLNQHAHLHGEYEGEQVLISYTKRRAAGRDYYLALSVDMGNVLMRLLPQELEPLRETSRFSIVDIAEPQGTERVIYGDALDSKSSFLYERAFPSTLWRWRIQMAPRNIWELARQSRKRGTADALLIVLALGIIGMGMLVLLMAIGKERRANEAKSDFIANVSHELKTPLSLVRMFSELLALGKVKGPDQAKEYAEIIMRESERLGRLIDNVLDFARIERKSARYEFREGDLVDVIERGLDVYHHRLEREQVQLKLEVDRALPPVLIDENAMTLALLNLLENAVKYAGPGPLTVAVRRQGAEVLLEVRDQGPGIAPEEQKRIFERFYRAKTARVGTVRGSGIGLALVKQIAEAHHGRVTLQSGVGNGAKFTVWLPIAESDAAATMIRHPGDHEPDDAPHSDSAELTDEAKNSTGRRPT